MTLLQDVAGALGVSAELSVDLSAIVTNYRRIGSLCGAPVGAVVKADAYGLGMAPISAALAEAGCRDFFVAHLSEGLALRSELGPGPRIYVLNGVWPGSEGAAVAAEIVPVINTFGQARAWRGQAKSAPVAVQFDSGMSRLGLAAEDAARLADDAEQLGPLNIQLLMTHMACADSPRDPANIKQLAAFHRLAAQFPGVPVSFANSAAAVGGWASAGDLARAGLALFGINPVPGGAMDLSPAIRLRARVLQTRTITAGTGVGYGLTFVANAPTRIATVAMGYADGWPRSLSGRGVACYQGTRLPMAGRVSMDSFGLDISALEPGALKAGEFVDLISPEQTIEAVAEAAGTIPYEILTGLGSRLSRRFTKRPERPEHG